MNGIANADLMAGVKAKIQETFVNLIPDDQWTIMVKGVIDEWTRDGTDCRGEKIHSPFKKLVEEALSKKFTETIKTVLDSNDFHVRYNQQTGIVVGQALEKCITENSGAILMQFVATIISSSMGQMNFQLQQTLQNAGIQVRY